MDYKLLAIDMDDTLLGDDLKISERTQERIRLARDMGVRVIISTGRMFRSIVPFIKELELDGPSLVYNGAMVNKLNDEKPLLHYPIPSQYAVQISNIVEEAGFQLNAYVDDKLYVRKRTPEVLDYMDRTGVDSTEVGPIGDFLAGNSAVNAKVRNPTKLLVIHTDIPEINEMKEKLKDEFGDELSITGSKPYFIEITAKDISKGNTLAELAEMFDIDREEVIAIGDGMNDYEMIQWAGLGVAVENAHPDLKEEADYVTASCNDDGVAQVIDKFILKGRE